jgi:hypothetical protein
VTVAPLRQERDVATGSSITPALAAKQIIDTMAEGLLSWTATIVRVANDAAEATWGSVRVCLRGRRTAEHDALFRP